MYLSSISSNSRLCIYAHLMNSLEFSLSQKFLNAVIVAFIFTSFSHTNVVGTNFYFLYFTVIICYYIRRLLQKEKDRYYTYPYISFTFSFSYSSDFTRSSNFSYSSNFSIHFINSSHNWPRFRHIRR